MMNRTLITLGLGAVLATGAFAQTAKESVKSFFDNPNFIIKKETAISENLKAVSLDVKVMGPNGLTVRPVKAFAATIDGVEYGITGNIYNEKGEAIKLPVNKELIKSGTSWTFGEGTEELYLVTNPSCSWCKKFEEKVEATPAFLKKYKINVMLMPFGAGAKEKAAWVMSAQTDAEKAERYKKVMLKGDTSWQSHTLTPEQKVEIEKSIKASNAAAKELGAEGTPAVFDSNHQQIKNWMNIIN